MRLYHGMPLLRTLPAREALMNSISASATLNGGANDKEPQDHFTGLGVYQLSGVVAFAGQAALAEPPPTTPGSGPGRFPLWRLGELAIASDVCATIPRLPPVNVMV